MSEDIQKQQDGWDAFFTDLAKKMNEKTPLKRAYEMVESLVVEGSSFKVIFKDYLNILKEHEEELNEINVFPIADKDTGTNLRKTLDFELPETTDLKEFIHLVAEKALYNARGSSGNILALYLLGIDNNFDKESPYNTLTKAAEFAWENMYNPQEGTMLTLMKDVPNIEGDFRTFLEVFIDRCISHLMEGPDALPILKEKQVLDSGSLGFVLILCGIYKCMEGVDRTPKVLFRKVIDVDTDKNIEYRYCVEGLLHSYDKEALLNVLKVMGNELIVAELKDYINRDTLKFHIHTFNWKLVEDACFNYGKVLSFKVEDMEDNNKVLRS